MIMCLLQFVKLSKTGVGITQQTLHVHFVVEIEITIAKYTADGDGDWDREGERDEEGGGGAGEGGGGDVRWADRQANTRADRALSCIP